MDSVAHKAEEVTRVARSVRVIAAVVVVAAAASAGVVREVLMAGMVVFEGR